MVIIIKDHGHLHCCLHHPHHPNHHMVSVYFLPGAGQLTDRRLTSLLHIQTTQVWPISNTIIVNITIHNDIYSQLRKAIPQQVSQQSLKTKTAQCAELTQITKLMQKNATIIRWQSLPNSTVVL